MNTLVQGFLGIDIGTTSVSVALMNLEDGSNIFHKTLVHNAALPSDIPDAHLQDPKILFSSTKMLLEEIYALHYSVSAIGITGQMHGIIPVNNQGEATGPAYTWLDGRSHSFLDDMEKDLGTRIPSGYGAGTLYALLKSNSLSLKTVGVSDIPGWIAARLANNKIMATSASIGHSLGLFSMENLQFETKSWSYFKNITPPRILPSATFIGETISGIPICVPEGDNQAGFLASIHQPDLSIALNVGTSSQVSLMCPEERRAPTPSLEERPLPGKQVLLVGAGLAGGKSFELLSQLVKEIAKHHNVQTRNPFDIFDKLERPEFPLKVDARFAGTRHNPELRGAITNINFHNFSLGHLYWGIAESLVNEMLEMVGDYRTILDSPESYMVASGNALVHNSAMLTLFKESTGRPIRQLRDAEASARGVAMLVAAAYQGGIQYLPSIQNHAVRYQ